MMFHFNSELDQFYLRHWQIVLFLNEDSPFSSAAFPAFQSSLERTLDWLFPRISVGLFRMLSQNPLQNVSCINLFSVTNPSLIRNRSDRKTVRSPCNL